MTTHAPRIFRRLLCTIGVVTTLAACATVDRGTAPPLARDALWVVGGFANNTETPLAGQRAEAVVGTLLAASGLPQVQRLPDAENESLFEPKASQAADAALSQARTRGARYLLTGSVDEWRYKVGVDGEPAVGLALQLVDVETGKAIWSAVGGKSGWSRESLAAVAQQLARKLLEPAIDAARP